LLREREWDNGGRGGGRTTAGCAPAAAPAAAPASTDVTAEIQKLADLHDSGALTDEEFTAMKKKLLDYKGIFPFFISSNSISRPNRRLGRSASRGILPNEEFEAKKKQILGLEASTRVLG